MGKEGCRYNWHSAVFLGWPFPVIKYKYIFQIKYTEAILSNSTLKLLWFEISKMLIAVFAKIHLSCYLLQFSADFCSPFHWFLIVFPCDRSVRNSHCRNRVDKTVLSRRVVGVSWIGDHSTLSPPSETWVPIYKMSITNRIESIRIANWNALVRTQKNT